MFFVGNDLIEVKTEALKILKHYGIKHRFKKIELLKWVDTKDAAGVFKTPLERLPLKEVKLPLCDQLISVPTFVVESCNYLRERLDTVGIFRRSGAAMRQKELKKIFLTGGKFPIAHEIVADVAGLLKLFFRELPQPCIPYEFHDALQRCMDNKDMHRDLVFTTILLLPTVNLHTLVYLMQFLNEVTLHQKENQMDASNLAVVWMPNLMPFKTGLVNNKNVIEKRLAIVQLLIENPSSIGVLPACLYEHISFPLFSHDELNHSTHQEKKKKKRRSGSLTRMLTGLKKMVKSSGVEETQHFNVTPENPTAEVHTPCILSTGKKRKAKESQPVTFSAKKRREVVELLPQKSLLPDVCPTSHLTPCALVSQHEKKRKSSRSVPGTKRFSHFGFSRKLSQRELTSEDSGGYLSTTQLPFNHSSPSEDFVCISRNEYEDIKCRVSKIESRISSEFENLIGVSISDLEMTPDRTQVDNIRTVQSVYEKTLESAEKLNSNSSDELAKRFSRNLKIRGSSEKKVIRSPSARKIGSVRRRSKENIQVKRNLSFNIANRNNTQFYSYGLRRGKPNTIFNGLPNLSQTTTTNPEECVSSFTNQLKFESLKNQNLCSNNQFEPKNLNLNSFGVLTRSQTRRASSFHGCDLSKIPTNVPSAFKCDLPGNSLENSTDWKNAETFFKEEGDSLENGGQGRPSLAKLRSQNAGMVLAKAKMFNTMIYSDGNIRNCKEVSNKPRAIKKRNSSKSSKERKVSRKVS